MENECCNEQELLQRVKAGDKAAFAHIYELYSEGLFLNLRRLLKHESEAEEVLQDIFLLLWQKRATILIHQSLKSYLFRIAENKVHDFYRKLKREKIMYAHITEFSQTETVNEEHTSVYPEPDMLYKAMGDLPAQRRIVFYLCKIKGKSYAEVSRLLGISTATINDHMVKAKRFVREFILSHPEMILFYMIIMLLGM
ncbi:MAG: sigma-70 family RNA polymerase sigma factor [Agriterribacter sp.]